MRTRARGWRGRGRGGRGTEGLEAKKGGKGRYDSGFWFGKKWVGGLCVSRIAWYWELRGVNSRSQGMVQGVCGIRGDPRSAESLRPKLGVKNDV